jgi:predicted ATPase
LKFNGRNLHEQSHGESFWAFFNKYNGAGLYIMDEPEAALSPQRQLSLLIHIKEMEEVGSQFIIISHSPILLGYPDADIISFDDGEVHRISYEETESYQVTEMFINNRKQLLHQLFDE